MNRVWLDSISAFLGVGSRRSARLYTAAWKDATQPVCECDVVNSKSESFFCYCNENRRFVTEAACPPQECRKEIKGLWLTRQVTGNIGNENRIKG